jgi:hypothetical protein
LKEGGRLGEILQGKEISLGKGKVAPLHTLLTSLPYLQYGPTSLHVLKAGLDMLTPKKTGHDQRDSYKEAVKEQKGNTYA